MAHRKKAAHTVFPETVDKRGKQRRGTTSVAKTPLELRTEGADLSRRQRELIRETVSRKLAKYAAHIERVTTRVRDMNGPRGGEDIECKLTVVVSGLPTVVVSERGAEVVETFERTIRAATVAVGRALDRSDRRTPRARGRDRLKERSATKVERARGTVYPPPEQGSLIGRRVGHGKANLAAALDRPEKRRRDTGVDTAQPGVSATDRRAGGASTARRNSKANTAGMTAALEDSVQDRPSRKSTRGSANRSKRDAPLRQREVQSSVSPGKRAERGRASRT